LLVAKTKEIAEMYESTMDALTHLYDKVSEGGSLSPTILEQFPDARKLLSTFESKGRSTRQYTKSMAMAFSGASLQVARPFLDLCSLHETISPPGCDHDAT
jgi:hypothetical protein